jgi:hypothetical protein
LAEQIGRFGPVAYLVTVSADGAPHVVSVTSQWDGDTLVVGAGRKTTANIQSRPDVTLLWPAPPGTGYSLIVDGSAHAPETDDATLRIRPVAAVLHRTPEGDPESPSCVTLLSSP